MMVARGYESLQIGPIRTNGLQLPALRFDLVEVNNPWPPNVGAHEWITYGNYVSGADHTHWDDFYNIRSR